MKIFKWIEMNLQGLNLTTIIILDKLSFLNRVFLGKKFLFKKYFIFNIKLIKFDFNKSFYKMEKL